MKKLKYGRHMNRVYSIGPTRLISCPPIPLQYAGVEIRWDMFDTRIELLYHRHARLQLSDPVKCPSGVSHTT